MVNNDREVWIKANLIQHKEHAEFGEVMAALMPNYMYGLDGIEVETIDYNKDPEKEVMKALLDDQNWAPYFCTAFDKHGEWTDDMKLCKSKTKMLFGKALKRADHVKIIHVWGDYYGDWSETVVVMQNFDTDESLYLQFDIQHEI